MDWDKVRDTVLRENIMQKTTIATIKKEYGEITKRLQTLSDKGIDFIARYPYEDARLVNFWAVLMTYDFIKEFVGEVMVPKWFAFDRILLHSDYQNYYDHKAEMHEKLATISQQTQGKIREVLFRILAEAGLIQSTRIKVMVRPVLSAPVIDLIKAKDKSWLVYFLYSSQEIKSL